MRPAVFYRSVCVHSYFDPLLTLGGCYEHSQTLPPSSLGLSGQRLARSGLFENLFLPVNAPLRLLPLQQLLAVEPPAAAKYQA